MNDMHNMKVGVNQEQLKEIVEAVKDMQDGRTDFMIHQSSLGGIEIEITTPNFRLVGHIQKILNGETMAHFKAMKMRINNPDHSKAVQEWLFEQGYSFTNIGKNLIYLTDIEYFVTEDDRIIFGWDNWESWDNNEEIDVQHLDPHLKSVKQSSLASLSTQLKHLDKAIASHDNKQNKRKIDRQRIIDKMEGMLPDNYKIVCDESVDTFDPSEIVVGSVWKSINNNTGKTYRVNKAEESVVELVADKTTSHLHAVESLLTYFKRIK